MSYGCHSRRLFIICVGKDGAFGEQPIQSTRVFAAIARQIVIAELVDRDRQNQLRLVRRGDRRSGRRE